MMLLAAAWLLCCARARARNATSRALAAPPDRRCKDEPRCLNELGDEVFDRAVDALRRCKKRDDAYLSCDLGDGWYGWTTEFYRFARAKIRPDGGLALLEGFDIPSCSGRSHRGSPQDRFCEFAREGVNDREAVFLANPWGGNFQHFMFELLPRAWIAAELLRRARPDAPPPELVLGPHMRQAFHVESVRLATGLAPKIIGDMENQPAYGHVWVPPYAAENFGDWSALGLKALREIHGDLQRRFVSGPPTKRLAYFTRRDAAVGKGRAMLNEPDFVKALEALGADVLEFSAFGTMEDRVRGLANYSTIVTPFGAAVANLVFSPASTRWINVCPPTMCSRNEENFIGLLAGSLMMREHRGFVRYTDRGAAHAVDDADPELTNGDYRNHAYRVDVDTLVAFVARFLDDPK